MRLKSDNKFTPIVSGYYRKYLDFQGKTLCKQLIMPDGLQIQQFQPEDQTRILELYHQAFGQQASHKQILDSVKKFKNAIFLYKIDGTILGYSMSYTHIRKINGKKRNIAIASMLVVDTAQKKRGIGFILLSETVKVFEHNKYHSIYAMIKEDNIASQKMAQKTEFTLEGPFPNLYGSEAGYTAYKILNE